MRGEGGQGGVKVVAGPGEGEVGGVVEVEGDEGEEFVGKGVGPWRIALPSENPVMGIWFGIKAWRRWLLLKRDGGGKADLAVMGQVYASG